MTAFYEPNPPSRKNEDFPKTNTIPGGWSMDELMDTYNGAGERADSIRAQELAISDTTPVPVPTTGGATPGGHLNGNGRTHAVSASQPEPAETESPFARQLEPFPTDAQLPGMWL